MNISGFPQRVLFLGELYALREDNVINISSQNFNSYVSN